MIDIELEIHQIGMDSYERGFRDGINVIVQSLAVMAERGDIQPLNEGILEGLKAVAKRGTKINSSGEIPVASG